MNRLEWVVYEAIHAYGLAEMADLLRISPQMLVNKINPKHLTHNLTLHQLLVILETTQASQIVLAIQERGRLQAPCYGNLLATTLPNENTAVFDEHSACESWSQHDARVLEEAANEAVHAIGEAVSASWMLARRGAAIDPLHVEMQLPG